MYNLMVHIQMCFPDVLLKLSIYINIVYLYLYTIFIYLTHHPLGFLTWQVTFHLHGHGCTDKVATQKCQIYWFHSIQTETHTSHAFARTHRPQQLLYLKLFISGSSIGIKSVVVMLGAEWKTRFNITSAANLRQQKVVLVLDHLGWNGSQTTHIMSHWSAILIHTKKVTQ